MECNHLGFLDGWMPCCTKYVRLSMALSCCCIRGLWCLFCVLQVGPGPLS